MNSVLGIAASLHYYVDDIFGRVNSSHCTVVFLTSPASLTKWKQEKSAVAKIAAKIAPL